MGANHFEKKYQKVPIKIGMSIAIAIGFVFLILFILGGAWAQGLQAASPRIKANGNGNAPTNFYWCFLVLFFKMV